MVVAIIASPIIALLFTEWWNRRGTRLLSYFSHVSAFAGTAPAGGTSLNVNTHSVVVFNRGRRAATNVRFQHTNLPSFSIWPRNTIHHVHGTDIVLPRLLPNEWVEVSYLYFPPMTFQQVNAGIRSDEVFARPIPMILQRHYPRWFAVAVRIVELVGLSAVTYGLYRLGERAVRF